MFNKQSLKKYLKLNNAIVIITMALLFYTSCNVAKKTLIIYNIPSEQSIRKEISYRLDKNDFFSVEFIHSVNNSPVIEYYKFDDQNNIYVYKTIYYNYGAGVPTDIANDETMSFGDDGSMIIDHIDKRIDNLTFYLSDIHDHILKINDKNPISLWEIFGKKQIVYFHIK